MSKYEVGYKAIVEIDKVFEQDGEKLYRAKGMKSLVFDGKGLDKLEPIDKYKIVNLNAGRLAGQNEAWELAKKCMLMTDRERETIFGSGHNALYGVLTYFDYKHAASKVAEWEKVKEIKAGDIVESNNGNGERIAVIDVWPSADGLHFEGISSNKTLTIDASAKYYTKTGRHIDIDSFLKQIGGEEG